MKLAAVVLTLTTGCLLAGCLAIDTMVAGTTCLGPTAVPWVTRIGASSVLATDPSGENSSAASADDEMPTPLTAKEIYRRLAPTAAYIVTPSGTGSGILIKDGYAVTNAHVVWPFVRVRIVLANGAAYDMDARAHDTATSNEPVVVTAEIPQARQSGAICCA